MSRGLDLVFLGLSITSSWGNGHATTYRALIRALAKRGHRVRFFERDQPWYAENRDCRHPEGADVILYESLSQLSSFSSTIQRADAVLVGSYVPDGSEVIDLVLSAADGSVAFYDIDTPVTLHHVSQATCKYLRKDQIPEFDCYFSFTGGQVLTELVAKYQARQARPLYCSVDLERYKPLAVKRRWDLGYLGTYSEDRQKTLERSLLQVARKQHTQRFVVAGSQYPSSIDWPRNVERIEHLSPDRHAEFYAAQKFSLNVTRAEMLAVGYAPSVRLFESAACGIPVISDRWSGLEEFFEPGQEILIADNAEQVLSYLKLSDGEAQRIGENARRRVLRQHSAEERARQFETDLINLRASRLRASANLGTSSVLQ